MEDANGAIKNSSAVSHLNGKSGGRIVGPKGRTAIARRPSIYVRAFSIISRYATTNNHPAASALHPSPLADYAGSLYRLLTWYTLLTILFRCPATSDLCDDVSPRVCRPYFRVKDSVDPHLHAYYDTYAAPYVEIANPYYDKVD